LYYIISSTQKPFSITFNGDGINDEFNLKSKNNEDIFKGYNLYNKELTQVVYFYKIVSANHVKHGTITIVK
jgi:hypothetical protein